MEGVERFVAALEARDEHQLETLALDPEVAGARDASGVSLVLLALYHGLAEVGRTMAHRMERETDSFEAAALGDAERLRAALDAGTAVDARAADGYSALGFACFFGQLDCARVLVELGADVAAPADNAMRVSPINSAAACREPATALALCELLLARGADPDAAQQAGYRPLHQAAAHGHAELVDLLLMHGADTDVQAEDGRTPADLAREGGHTTLISRLTGGTVI